jgi:prepilin signal peptidase PulO-like enzyme (type II secretory pathway)
MPIAVTLIAAAVAAAGGWFAAGWQHLLYRQEEYRAKPPTGRTLLALRLFLGVGGSVVVGLALRPDHYDAGPAILTAIFGLVLLVLSSTDFECRIIPNSLSYPAIVMAAAFCWAWPERGVQDVFWGAALAIGVAAGMFTLGLAFGAALGARATPFGLGDVKLIVLLGLLLGWPAIMNALLIGVVAAGIPALVLMLRGQGRGVFSYGPYLALGGVAALLWPERFT